MSDVKWIKIVTDIFDDEKILLIESLPDADSIIVIWFKLLCFAGKQNNNGVLMMNDRIAYTDKMLATIFRRNESTVRLALETFESFGMIEIIDGVITIPNWDKHQNIEGMERIREQTRARVQKHRDKMKMLTECNVTDNVTVTLSNATDKNRIDKNRKEKKKESILDEIENEDLRTALREFGEMRKLIKKPMTERAWKNLLSKLNSLSDDEQTQIEILNQSIDHAWQSVYPIKREERDTASHGWDYDELQRLAESKGLSS